MSYTNSGHSNIGSTPCWMIHAWNFVDRLLYSTFCIQSSTCSKEFPILPVSLGLLSNQLPKHFTGLSATVGTSIVYTRTLKQKLSSTLPFFRSSLGDSTGLNDILAHVRHCPDPSDFYHLVVTVILYINAPIGWIPYSRFCGGTSALILHWLHKQAYCCTY